MFFSTNPKQFRAASCLIVFCLLVFCQTNFAQTPTPSPLTAPKPSVKGKMPVIVIPGLLGSELVNAKTDEVVWFDLRRAKDDDLRLPISPNLAANKDNLVPRDILRNIKYLRFLPETEIYQKAATSLEVPGDYTEGKWDAPTETGYQDTYYVFPYDWRRDNVENARLLIKRMDELKRKLKRPDLKFNIIAHSMGGLIARYAAMYGDADLPAGTRLIKPTWAGAADINKIFLVGTPNEGSLSSLDGLINGYSISPKGINLPFVQDLTRFDMFTIPSLFELLPHGGTIRAFDEDKKPLKIDIYSPATWEKYGWTAYTDPKFSKEFTIQEQRGARAYFRAVLNRARRFHQALDANITAKTPVAFYFLGSDCKPTLDAMLIYRDGKKDIWRTLFHADDFKRSDGVKVSGKDLEDLLLAKGDGVVTQRSFLTSTIAGAKLQSNGYQTALPARDISFVCDAHTRLLSNADVQNKLFADLISK
ncbi:MAG: lipase/acyltransferase domain-containing protein [Pyrinomonadaceae bacterium]